MMTKYLPEIYEKADTKFLMRQLAMLPASLRDPAMATYARVYREGFDNSGFSPTHPASANNARYQANLWLVKYVDQIKRRTK